jgi:hypothetical protein
MYSTERSRRAGFEVGDDMRRRSLPVVDARHGAATPTCGFRRNTLPIVWVVYILDIFDRKNLST